MERSARRSTRVRGFMAAVACTGLAVLAGAQADAERELMELVQNELEVEHFELVRLALPDVPRSHVASSVSLGGRTCTLELRPYSQRARDFRVWVDEGGRSLREVEPPPSGTYRGVVREIPASRVAASQDAGRWKLQLHLAEDELWFLEPLAQLGPGADGDEYVAYRARDVRSSAASCGALAAPGLAPAPGGSSHALTINHVQITEIAFDADFEYFQLNSSSVNATVADIESVMNALDVIYARDVDIVHRFTGMIVRTTSNDPYTHTDGQLLLAQFADHWNLNHPTIPRDVAHLMTGRNLDGNWVGFAYLSTVCTTDWAYGLSQSRYTGTFHLRVALTAHELGHNWGANHCDGVSPCRIMCSTIGGCSGTTTNFAPVSIASIENYRNSVGCLGSGGRLYVDRTAAGFENGLDWTNAFVDLQRALTLANPGDEVWVAAGTYTPDPSGVDRDASFVLPEGVEIYGGFDGSETQLAQRDPIAHPTILSGELGGGARSYHVVTVDGAGSGTLLDGFTVRAGRSDGSGLRAAGAGMLIDSGTPRIRTCVFESNVASIAGGALFTTFGAEPSFEDCVFRDNTADDGGALLHRGGAGATFARCVFRSNTAHNGGALYVDQAGATFSDCLFASNTALDPSGAASHGGAAATVVADFADGPTFVGCTFHGNAATGSSLSRGGGLHASKFGSFGTALTLVNCILWGNVQGSTQPGTAQLCAASGASSAYDVDSCCVQDGLVGIGGGGMITLDPHFVAAGAGDLRLSTGSPCIDAGDDARVPAFANQDLGGLPRIQDGDSDGSARVDMGAHEHVPDCNGNGVPDAQDIAMASSTDVDSNGVPDECEVVASGYCTCAAALAPCGNVDGTAGCANSTGAGAKLEALGTSSVIADDLVLVTSHVPANQFALYYFGQTAGSFPFGDGLRCIGGSTQRFLPLQNSGASGTLTLGPGIVARSHAFPAAFHIAPFASWNFQSWYRDAQGPCVSGFNLSDAVLITFTP